MQTLFRTYKLKGNILYVIIIAEDRINTNLTVVKEIFNNTNFKLEKNIKEYIL